MSTPSSERRRRISRALATSAAAVAVTLLPTACDFASASGPLSGGTGGGTTGGQHAGHGGGDAVVVPVARTESAAPTTDAEAPAGEAPAGEAPAPGGAPAPEAPAGEAPPSSEAPASEAPPSSEAPASEAPATEAPAPSTAAPAPATNGLDVLGQDCTNSKLEAHDGFQKAPRCVSTSFGEVAAAAQSPSLLITGAPEAVGVGEAFQLQVSTRNLVRDRFLGAAVGGYYLESSFLDENGLQRGHFHTACRILPSTDEAPDSSPAPAFFVATQDNGGGSEPDTVTINVPGVATAGTLQCASWAGDGSHRVPMMERANQTPAFDAVRITVGGGGDAEAPAAEEGAGN